MSILIRKLNQADAMRIDTPERFSPKRVEAGFATTTYAFDYFLQYNSIDKLLNELMENIDKETFSNLKEMSWWAKRLILNGRMPADLIKAIQTAHKELSVDPFFVLQVKVNTISKNTTGLNGPKSFSDVKDEKELITAVQNCFASFYDEGAIRYRLASNLQSKNVAMEVEVKNEMDYEAFLSNLHFTDQPQHSLSEVHDEL